MFNYIAITSALFISWVIFYELGKNRGMKDGLEMARYIMRQVMKEYGEHER